VTTLRVQTSLLTSGGREHTRPGPVTEVAKLGTSVGKAVAILNAFRSSGGAPLGVSQIAERTRLAKSTSHRILTVLVENGYLERTGDRYRLSRAIFELGQLARDFPAVAADCQEGIADEDRCPGRGGSG
jgi:DNA-binding MarR family transcriptional regulator